MGRYSRWHKLERDSKAIWIPENGPIIEFPECKFMHVNTTDDLICGEPKEDSGGGMVSMVCAFLKDMMRPVFAHLFLSLRI